MTRAECVRKSLKHLHRNWQLVVIQFLMTVVNVLAFLLFLALPLAVGLLLMGDVALELEGLEDVLESPARVLELVFRYLGWAAVLAAGLLFCLVFSFSLWIFVLGGSLGVLILSMRRRSGSFSRDAFMEEGKRHFLPLLRYTALVGFLFVGTVSALALCGGLAYVVSTAVEGGRPAVFLRVLMALGLGVFGFLFLAGIFFVALEGFAPLVTRRMKAAQAVSEAGAYLWRNPGSIGLIVLLLAAYASAQVLMMAAGYSVGLIPHAGPMLSVFVQVVGSVLSGYLFLAVIGAVLADYLSSRGEIPPGEAHGGLIAGGSTPGSRTSPSEALGRGSLHPPWGKTHGGPRRGPLRRLPSPHA
jgi:hypothetical protein